MTKTIIASYKCHDSESSSYTLFKMNEEYKYEKTWFNAHLPSDRMVETYTSKDPETVADMFFNSAKLTLDTTKEYNRDVTDEQRLKIRDAMNDVHEYFEYLELEENP